MFRNKILIFIIVIFSSKLLIAQSLCNEWINYEQQYFKIPITQEGIYKLDYTTLSNANVPINSFDPRSIQIFCKGIEQYIYVSGEKDGVFSSSDYIEFYAKPNDGFNDSVLYKGLKNQANPYYSLFNDTAIYYLTWNSSLNNKRLSVVYKNNFSDYPANTFFWKEIINNYNDSYYGGETNPYGSTDVDYITTEGWFHGGVTQGLNSTINITSPQIFTLGPSASLEYSVVSASNFAPINPDQHLRISLNNYLLNDTVFDGYQMYKFNKTISSSILNSSNNFNFASINDLGSTVSRLTIGYIKLKYPHTNDLENSSFFKFLLQKGNLNHTHVKFMNFNASDADSIWIYDLTGHNKIKVYKNSSNFEALIPDVGVERTCVITKTENIISIPKVYPLKNSLVNNTKFTNYLLTEYLNANYIIVTHKKFITEANNYKNYLSLKGFKVIVADVDELYDQFCYGIMKNPLAIKNYVKYLYQSFANKPEYLFIIGKGLETPVCRKNAIYYNNNYVPSMGFPASDVLFSSEINDVLYAPALATGRLAVRTPQQITEYLNKVIQQNMSFNNAEEWQKLVLHFGGGTTAGEQLNFSNYLRNYETIIEDTSFGGNVYTFLKTSTSPIQTTMSDSIRQLINNGVAMLSFFGHASGTSFDQSIDEPSSYNNIGKYPFVLANSCYSGDIFSTGISYSESFVLQDNKGAMSYLGSRTKSGASELNTYSNQLHKNLFQKNYNQTIGKSIQKTIKDIQSNNWAIKSACLEVTYHGDPSLSLYNHTKPDFSIDEASVFFSPSIVTTAIDSFEMNIVIKNNGKAILDNYFAVEVKRMLPNNVTESPIIKIFKTPIYKDTLKIKFPVNFANGIGNNTFSVVIDAYNKFDELSEANNTYNGYALFIKSNSVYPVYPYEFSIVPDDSIVLKASTGDPFSTNTMYLFELDTVPSFNSVIKKQWQVNDKGGVLKCTTNLSLIDSTVYFWRIYSNNENLNNVKISSFQYIKNRTGWSQANIKQFKQNTFNFINYNEVLNKFEFSKGLKNLKCYNTPDGRQSYYQIDNAIVEYGACYAYPSIHVAVLDSITLEPWNNFDYTSFGNINQPYSCRQRPENYFIFRAADNSQLRNLNNMLNAIPKGNYILVYSCFGGNFQNWNDTLYQTFEKLGSLNIRNIGNTYLYILYAKKGYPSTAIEEVGVNQSSIQINQDITNSWYYGNIVSTNIGPFKTLESLNWNASSYEINGNDSLKLSIIGIKNNSEQIVLNNNITAFNVPNLSSIVNTSTYSNLKLSMFTRDEITRTPSHLNKWMVFYNGVPEFAINPAKHFMFEKDTLYEGQKGKFSVAVENISNYDGDSLKINYWLVDNNRMVHQINYPLQKPLKINELLIDTIKFETQGFAGNNSIWVEVNPDNHQPEQYHFNNIAEKKYLVLKDNTNPLLDVTFDGIRILNGDIVSAKPHIEVKLKDENKFLLLDDTNNVKIYLKKPGEEKENRVYYINNELQNIVFTPASNSNNTCSIVFEPILIQDGKYQLIVQAKDASNNESGDIDYKISFEVINKSTITEILNWPNPFSTKTHFVFTLTGSEVPEFFKIQIMTITGKVVKEITQEEIGSIRIGKNITEYAWDGTDEFGDKLANGVYLYKVVVKNQNGNIEKRQTNASKYFVKDYGKMYIIR